MKLTIKTNEYEITKLPFDAVAEITIYDYVDKNTDELKKLKTYIAELEDRLSDLVESF